MTQSSSDDSTDDDQRLVHLGGRVLKSGMTEAEAIEYALEQSPLEIARQDDLNPICQKCGTVEEVAARSSNFKGYLCPVCDDPNVEIVE